MAIAVKDGQDMTKVLSDFHTAKLLGFSTSGRKTTEAPSRRILAIALGLAPDVSDRCSSLQRFVDAVNLALATHGPERVRYLGGGLLHWLPPPWSLPTTYRLTHTPTASGDGVAVGTGRESAYTVPVLVGGSRTYRVRAVTLVGDAQAADFTIRGLGGAAHATADTIAHEGGPNARPYLWVTITGSAAPYAQVLWERQDRQTGVWTTTFHAPAIPSVQRVRRFRLNLTYNAADEGTERFNIRCYVADGRPPSTTDYDYRTPTIQVVFENVAAS